MGGNTELSGRHRACNEGETPRNNLTPHALSTLLRQLLPLQTLDGPLHARPLAADRDDSARDSDSGTLARARVAWGRLQRIAEPHRSVLLWLAARAHGSDDLRALAGLVGAETGPVRLRDAVARAEGVRRRREWTACQASE